MGNATWTPAVPSHSPIDANAGYMMRGQITLSNSYVQGGDAINSALFGLGQIENVLCFPANGYVFGWNQNTTDAGAKVQAWYTGASANTVLNEVTNTTNFIGIPFEAIVYGY